MKLVGPEDVFSTSTCFFSEVAITPEVGDGVGAGVIERT
jgi:hypothetical protein